MIYIASDHRGFELKNALVDWLKSESKAVLDLGNLVLDPNDDYPEFAGKVAETVSADPEAKGIVICGSGVGVDVVANKFDGVRSGLGIEVDQVRSARSDDNINILSIASDFTDSAKAKELIKVFLATNFKGEDRFIRRLDEISDIEQDNK